MGYIDLEEAAAGRLDCWPLFSTRTPLALLSLLACDHMFNEPAERNLLARVRDLVERETGSRPRGPIRLLTNLRVCGVEFNPVSFYYVFTEDGKDLETVVAEVSNFPWFEQHCYVIRPVEEVPEGRPAVLRRFSSHDKQFHVSPFIEIPGVRYDWLVGTPAERVSVRIGVEHDGEGFFSAGLDAKRLPWSSWNLLKMQRRYPAHTLKVMTGILFEAVKLFRRGLQFIPHPTGTTTRLSRAVEVAVGSVQGVSATFAWIAGGCKAALRT